MSPESTDEMRCSGPALLAGAPTRRGEFETFCSAMRESLCRYLTRVLSGGQPRQFLFTAARPRESLHDIANEALPAEPGETPEYGLRFACFGRLELRALHCGEGTRSWWRRPLVGRPGPRLCRRTNVSVQQTLAVLPDGRAVQSAIKEPQRWTVTNTSSL